MQGVNLEFLTTPLQTYLPNTPVINAGNRKLIDVDIQALLSKRAVRESTRTNGSFYSNIFLVPKKGVELRPVINLRKCHRGSLFIIHRYRFESIVSLATPLIDSVLKLSVHEM